MADTVLDLLTDAMMEINALAAGEPMTAEDAAFCLRKLNHILDEWSARRLYVPNVNFQLYTLTPNLQPHTIGPTGTFVVASRPVRIDSASLVLNTTNPATDMPIRIRDDDWWANQRVKSQKSSTPTDLYYSPDMPNGSCYLWPIPSAANGLRLQTWSIIGKFASTAVVLNLPPGYQQALTLTLAEAICEPFKQEPGSMLTTNAVRARRTIAANNDESSRISLIGFGGKKRSGFNYFTGQPN
jgi:hypothetical protein